MGFLTSWQSTAVAAGLAAVFFWLFLDAREDVAAAVERCNAQKLSAVAEAEKIARTAAERAAAAKLAQLEAQMAQETAAVDQEREKRAVAEAVAAERQDELDRLAQEAFDEDELPDSDACLNAFVTSRALRCVLHARDSGEAGAGGGGDNGVCADPGGTDGMHPGFSNVTYLDALQYWGGDRDAAIRLNGRLAAIEKISGESVDGN